MFLSIKMDKIGRLALRGEAAKAVWAENSLASMVVSGRQKVPSDKAGFEKHCLLENQDGKLGHLDIANKPIFFNHTPFGSFFYLPMLQLKFMIEIKVRQGGDSVFPLTLLLC